MKKVKVCFLCLALSLIATFSLVGCGAKTVKITFDPTGGTMTETTVSSVAGAKLPAVATPTKDGFVFIGWFTDSGCSDDSRWDNNQKVEADITLYAGWATDTYVTVSYDLGLSAGETAENAPEDGKIKPGSLVFEPAAPVRSGYNFKGWYKDKSFNNEFDFSTETVYNDTSIYAKWAKLYTVTVKDAGGATISSTAVEDGSALSSVPAPTKRDHCFVGYFGEAEFTNPVISDTVISENTTVYAKLVKPTDTSLYGLTIIPESRDDKYNKNATAYIYTKPDQDMEEIVLPSKVNGYTISSVSFYNAVYNEQDGTWNEQGADFHLNVGNLVIPTSVYNIYLRDSRCSIGSYEVAQGSEWFASYGGCVYGKNTYQYEDDNGNNINSHYYYLSIIPSALDGSVIDLMPGAMPSSGFTSKTFRLSGAPSDYMKRNGLHWGDSWRSDKYTMLVDEEYYEAYSEIEHSKSVGFYKKAWYDEATSKVIDKETHTFYAYAGNESYLGVTIGDGDGVTAIADDAFYGCSYIYIGTDVTDIVGMLNSYTGNRINCKFLGDCPANINFDGLFATNSYTIYIPATYLTNYQARGLTRNYETYVEEAA